MLKKDVFLRDYSSYKIGGPVKYFFEINSLFDLKEALFFSKSIKKSVFILGSGTNILFPDEGLDRVVLRNNLKYFDFDEKNNLLVLGSGLEIKEILDFCVKNSLKGLSWAGGLPGTLGGALKGNAGAFSGEIKDLVVSVTSLSINEPDKLIKRDKEDCQFSYRNSIFKQKNDEFILEAVLKFEKGESEEIEREIKEKINYRFQKQPLNFPNAGSVFKNVPLAKVRGQINFLKENEVEVISLEKKNLIFRAPVKNDPFLVIPAAYLISECNLKGQRIGQAEVSVKHPNFIVNLGKARAKDVKELINLIKERVYNKFLIELEEEIIIF